MPSRTPALTLLLALALPMAATAASTISVTDDQGNTVTLTQPARRIVSLAPHTTELLFAAGAGDYLVGVSNFSDYPAAASKIRSIGRIRNADLETIITLKPDLVVAWHSGNSAAQLARLRQLNIPVFESQPNDFDMIATSIERLSRLSATETTGNKAAADFRNRWHALEQRYRNRSSVSVFYQIWSQPLTTLNGDHMVSTVLRTCGGRNIFAGLPQLAPTVSVEAVLAADPDAILTPSDAKDAPLKSWQRFSRMKAVAANNLFMVNADWLNRAGPRIVDATEEVCKTLDIVRTRGTPAP